MGVLVFHEADVHAVLVFQVVEHTVVVLAEHVDHLGAYHEGHFAELALCLCAGHPAVDHAERGFERRDASAAVANRAAFGLFGHQVHADALTGDFHEAELADGGGADRGLVAADCLAEFLVDLFVVFFGFHIDKVDNDQATHIAEPKLLCDFVAGVDVRFEDDLALVFAVHLRSGVHVDRDECFGLFDDEVAATRERYLALQGTCVVVFDLEVFEQAFVAAPELHLVELVRREYLEVFAQGEVFVAVVDIHVVGVVAEVFAHSLFDGIRFFVDAGFGRLVFEVVLRLFPLAFEFAHLLVDFEFGFVQAVGTNDVAHVATLEAADHLLEFAALGRVAFTLGDTNEVGARHAHEETTRKAQVSGQTGTLGADRFLDHLNHDFLAFLQNFVNRDFLGRTALVIVVAIFATEKFVSVHGVFLMQKACLFKANINERSLECRKHLLDHALVNIAQNSIRRNAFDDKFNEFAVFHDGDALFVRRFANQNSTLALICH